MMEKAAYRVVLLAGFLLLAAAWRLAAQDPDSLHAQLDSTVFAIEKKTIILQSGVAQPTEILTSELRKVPTILGNADPLRFVRLLPGVQTGMELDAGLHIQGTENSHCLVSVEGVPIYGATHLLGLFSTFIPTHYRSMQFTPFTARANRLGGSVEMKLPDSVPERLRGSFTAGLFEGEGTLDIPLGKKSGLFVSARKSYLNLLYGSFLRMDVYSFRYSMADGNITWYWRPNDRHRVWVDGYGSGDWVDFNSARSKLKFKFDWNNWMAAAHHQYTWDGGFFRQTLYHSQLGQTVDFRHSMYDVLVPTTMATTGYKAWAEAGRWRFGLDVAWHHSAPQQITLRNQDFQRVTTDPILDALEATAEAQYVWPVASWLTLQAGVKGILYRASDGSFYPAVLPQASALWKLGWMGKLELVAGMARQNLIQTGMSNLGMPTELWFVANKDMKPQGSAYASLTWGRTFFAEKYSVSASAYYRALTNQVDYAGSLLDYMQANYSAANTIIVGDGRNYGLCFTLQKQAGAFTGWIAYTLSRSLRTFQDYTFPSNHERIHECNVVANYSVGKWDFGAVMVAATGTPYTSAESFYILSGSLITNFTKRNADRLKPYFRLDVATTYYFLRKGSRESSLTFSLYNAVGYKNDVFLQLTEENSMYSYKPFALHLRFLPTLSYCYKF